jgi:hypothetical protein
VASLTNQIDDQPVIFSALKMINGQFRSLTPAKPATQQHCQECSIAFAFPESGSPSCQNSRACLFNDDYALFLGQRSLLLESFANELIN